MASFFESWLLCGPLPEKSSCGLEKGLAKSSCLPRAVCLWTEKEHYKEHFTTTRGVYLTFVPVFALPRLPEVHSNSVFTQYSVMFH